MRSWLRQESDQRPRGRPRRIVPTVATSVKVPEDVYDAVCRMALRDRESVHALIREAIVCYVRAHPK